MQAVSALEEANALVIAGLLLFIFTILKWGRAIDQI